MKIWITTNNMSSHLWHWLILRVLSWILFTFIHDFPQCSSNLFIWIFLNWFVLQSSTFRWFSIIHFFSTCEGLKHFFQWLEANKWATASEENKTYESYQWDCADKVVMFCGSLDSKSDSVITIIKSSEIFLEIWLSQYDKWFFLFVLLFRDETQVQG